MHDLQFVNAGRGHKRRPYGRGILQRHVLLTSIMPALNVAMSVSFRLPHPVEMSVFIMCRGLCAEML